MTDKNIYEGKYGNKYLKSELLKLMENKDMWNIDPVDEIVFNQYLNNNYQFDEKTDWNWDNLCEWNEIPRDWTPQKYDELRSLILPLYKAEEIKKKIKGICKEDEYKA